MQITIFCQGVSASKSSCQNLSNVSALKHVRGKTKQVKKFKDKNMSALKHLRANASRETRAG
jgi:hypothetical protein